LDLTLVFNHFPPPKKQQNILGHVVDEIVGLHHTPQGDSRELNPLVTHLFPKFFDLGPKGRSRHSEDRGGHQKQNGVITGNDVTQTTPVVTIFQAELSVCSSRRLFKIQGHSVTWWGKIGCKGDNDV